MCERYYCSRSILSKNSVLQLYHQKVNFSVQFSICLSVMEDAKNPATTIMDLNPPC